MRDFDWKTAWHRLAGPLGLREDAPVIVALSGGADSVLLLELVARAEPRPPLWAVHVEHGLRGEESEQDAEFCAARCRELGVPLFRRKADLDPERPGLEARAREARYRLLAREARRLDVQHVATGHHADDALETLLIRWLRGTELAGLTGPQPRLSLFTEDPSAPPIAVVRPLLAFERDEVRALLASEGIPWREDSSNLDPRYTRNRVRLNLLPLLRDICGEGALQNLRAFGTAVEALEAELASRTGPLGWRPVAHAPALRSLSAAHLGGTLPRADLVALARPLRRRALWRLLTEGSGHSHKRDTVSRILDDVERGRCTRHSLPGGWSLQLRSSLLHLCPPDGCLRAREPLGEGAGQQLPLPFAAGTAPDGLRLEPPGTVVLPDGRRISAELRESPVWTEVPHSPVEIELDADALETPLWVRWARPGDRFHPLGAPGRKKLVRFLRDAGVPRAERGRIPLVFAGGELVWVAGMRPSEAGRVHRHTTRRLRLRLLGAARAPGSAPRETGLFGRA